MWYVYLLQSEFDSSYYVGMSQDPKKRLIEHNSGKSKYTKGRVPWKIIYVEEVGSLKNARILEKYYKTTHGKRKLLDRIKDSK